MPSFEIVAHRGAPHPSAPENTLPAFEHAIEIGADFIELDVRLTKDLIPVIYHYYYLDVITTKAGPIFNFTYDQIKESTFIDPDGRIIGDFHILTLDELLETLGNRIGLEIELKIIQPEALDRVSQILNAYKPIWNSIEITSYESALLNGIKNSCPGLATDLLFPLSEPWMKHDVVIYEAIQRARLAQTRGIHLHPSQLDFEGVDTIRAHGLEVHAWDVEGEDTLQKIVSLEIPRFSSDNPAAAVRFRERLNQ